MGESPPSLPDLLRRVENGERLPAEPWLAVVPQPSPREAAVLAFPAYFVVAADVEPGWVTDRLPEIDFCAPLNPPFLRALEDHLDRRVNNIDMMMLAAAVAGPPDLPLTPVADADHLRVRRARRYRDDLRIWTVEGGVLVLGRGLGGRWEVGVEVDESHRNRGLGRRLAAAARHLVPDGRPVWAQVPPGNAASVRAFVAAGYEPIGAEALLVR